MLAYYCPQDQRLTYLEAVVGPAAELHDAGLLVEGEVLHVHLAGGVVDSRRLPLHPPVPVQRGLGGQSNLKVAVSTEDVILFGDFINHICATGLERKSFKILFAESYLL